MKNNTEKSEYLAGKIGVCWHEWRAIRHSKAICCKCGIKAIVDMWLTGNPLSLVIVSRLYPNPDYFSLAGRQELLKWAVKQEWWVRFLKWHFDSGGDYLEYDCIEDLLIPKEALAEALYSYLKGKENG